MKTAMQELIEWLDIAIEELKGNDSTDFAEGLVAARVKANKALEKEKEYIIDFHVMLMKNGLEQEGNAIEWDYNELKEEANKYYNQTYNQNK
jgi:hypothetical protein